MSPGFVDALGWEDRVSLTLRKLDRPFCCISIRHFGEQRKKKQLGKLKPAKL